MDKSKAIGLAFEQWAASLKSRDRTQKSVRPNFEELFETWKKIDCTFDDLHESHLPKAIKAHLPNDSIIRKSHDKFSKIIPNFDKSLKEFKDEWVKSISDTATEAFFEYFPPPILDDEDPEPKVYGNMSMKEYKAQRRYAEQFPVIDTTDLEERWKNQEYNLDIEDLIKHVLGEKTDETK